MKIAVLMDAPLRATLLSEKTGPPGRRGEVAVNETDKAEKETVKQILPGGYRHYLLGRAAAG